MFRKVLAVAAFAVLVAGCSDTTNGGGGSTIAPTVTESTGEPNPEPTTPESTGTKIDKPSINIANAPIGGDNPDVDGVNHCAIVNWLGRKPLPDGTTITVESFHLAVEKVFVLDQSACADDKRPCIGVKWQSDNFTPCYVGARQIANHDDEVDLIMKVSATCETQNDCDSLAKGFGKTQISFFPDIIETPTGETPSEQPSPDDTTPTDG